MKELPAIYRFAFAVGFIVLAAYYGRQAIPAESVPGETVPSNPPPVVQEASNPHPEPQPPATSSPVDPIAESRSETKSPVKETLSELRLVPAAQPTIRVVRVLAQDKLEIECHPNGNFLERGTIKRMPDQHWVQDGIWSNYWPKGTVSSVGEWKDGAQIGPWLFASEDGRSTVTNHPPFANTVAVAQQSVPPGATTTQDSVAVAKVDNEQETMPVNTGSDQAAEEPPVTVSSMVAAPSAKRTNPDLFVCGKHDSDPYLKDADALFLRGEWNRAKNAFSAYGDQHLNAPERAYAMLQKAVCEERMGKLPEARAAYQDFLRVFGREECGAKGQAGLAGLLWKQPPSRTQAVAEYEKLIKNYPTAPETATALKVLGDYFLGQKDYKRAQACYATHLQNFPEASDRAEIESQQQAAAVAAGCKDKMGMASGLGFKESVAQADALLDRGRFREADMLFQELASRFSGSPESASYCLMRMGICRLGLGRYDESRRQFEIVFTKYPSSKEAPEASWRYVQSLNNPQPVMTIAQIMAQKYPDAYQTQKIHFVLGTILESQGQRNRVYTFWAEFLQKWPDTAFRDSVKDRLAKLSPPPSNRINLGGQK